MKRITLVLSNKTPKGSLYTICIEGADQIESHLFEIRLDDKGSSMRRMMDFIKEIFERLEENLQ